MQVEDNAKKKQMFFLICIVETTPTLSKGSANRREYKINLFIFILEVQPTFTAGAVKGQVEDNAKKKQMFFLICIVEATPTLSIDSASGGSRRVASMI
uniref:hypothetical protein n=1 Tax=Prevotella sp. TaxID=59823 RepID=UPI0040264D4B